MRVSRIDQDIVLAPLQHGAWHNQDGSPQCMQPGVSIVAGPVRIASGLVSPQRKIHLFKADVIRNIDADDGVGLGYLSQILMNQNLKQGPGICLGGVDYRDPWGVPATAAKTSACPVKYGMTIVRYTEGDHLNRQAIEQTVQNCFH